MRSSLRILTAAGLLTLAAITGFQIWRRLEESYPLVHFDRTREAQQLASLRSYAAREKLGSFLPPGDAQLAIREAFLQDVLVRSLPIRQGFERGRYEARLDQARLDLEDGVATIILHGQGRMLGPNASPLEADLELQTHIDVVEFRPEVGTLRAGLVITGVHVIRAGHLRGRPIMNPVVQFFSGLKVEDWNRQRLSLEIPIRLERQIKLPELKGDVSLEARRIPLAIRVSALTVLHERLALGLALDPDSTAGESLAVARPEWALPKPADSIPTGRDLRRLDRAGRGRATRDRLIRQVRALAASDSLWLGLTESDEDVVVIVPQPVLQTLCNRVARRYLQGARLDFDPNLRAHLDEQIRVGLLGGNVGAGRIIGNVEVTHLSGGLRVSRDPKVTLLPPDVLEFATPIRVLEGQGRVKISMRWDPSFFVSVVCRAFGFQETLVGEVVPFSHVLRTRLRFVAGDSSITGRPVVRRDRVRVPCEFTEPSLAKVRAVLAEQDRFLRCGIAMNPDTVLTKIRQLVRRGIPVNLPSRLFKPFSLPVTLERQYEAGDFRIAARAREPDVAVRSSYVRFGFRAELMVRPIARPGRQTAAR